MIDIAYKTSYDNVKRDPDGHDPVLRDHHQLLWSKTLPDGRMFNLTVSTYKPYRLFHSSDAGDFSLSSDCITHSYSRIKNKQMKEIINNFPKNEIDSFFDLACTIGGYIVFPSNKVNNQPTINGLRGINSMIKDRFDFTLECIRRWYIGEMSPLRDCFNRYRDFFQLFGDFNGYVKFFLLDDLVDDRGQVKFWLPFKDFGVTRPLPSSVDEYKKYMKNVSDFVKARNAQIDKTMNL